MGSMKRKRRKQQAKEWTEFQEHHHLSDECLKLARVTGYPLKLLKVKLANSTFDEAMSMADRIGEINRQWQCRLVTRQPKIESGEIRPKPKKSKNKLAHDPQWAKAKQVCRLNMEEIRMAKELGLTPKSLMKNVPSSTQPWKAPVKVWVRELYEQRQRRSHSGSSSEPATSKTFHHQTDEDTHDGIVNDWKQSAERNDGENYEFLRSLKHRDYGFEPDELVAKLHDQAFKIVDCSSCANCCKTLNIQFDVEDIKRIAGHLDMQADAFIESHLEAVADGTYRTRQKPCPFLGDDNRCTIYDVRPTVCQAYPCTDKEGLVFRTIGVANNAQVCPAVFWIVEQMKGRAEEH